jgi:hypothetical protein
METTNHTNITNGKGVAVARSSGFTWWENERIGATASSFVPIRSIRGVVFRAPAKRPADEVPDDPNRAPRTLGQAHVEKLIRRVRRVARRRQEAGKTGG